MTSIPQNDSSQSCWLDEVGYESTIRLKPEVLKMAIQDPSSVWPYLESTFRRYQPFEGLQVKQSQSGQLQKVEDLQADVIQMQFKDGPTKSTTTSTNNSMRGRAATAGTSSRFGFGLTPPPPPPSAITSDAIVAAESAQATATPATANTTADTDNRSELLRPSLKHPMYWHLYPYVHIFICTTVNVDDYIKNVKPQIKRFVDYFTPPPSGTTSGSNTPLASSPATPMANSTSASTPPETDLRYQTGVLILYAPILEDSAASLATIAASSSFGSGGFSSLFKKSSSFSGSPSGGTTSAAALAEDRINQIKASRKVYERLRNDFGSKDTTSSQTTRIDLYDMIRNIDTNLPLTSASPPITLDSSDLLHQWDELIAKIVRCLIRSHETRTILYENELKQSLLNSNLTGWNFCHFFVLKASYALFHEQMGLRGDALRLYQELKLMFDELNNPTEANGNGARRLRYLLDSTRSKLKDSSTSAESSSTAPIDTIHEMPGPLLDIFAYDYPLLILHGQLNELEWARYLTAQSLWLMIKMNKNAASHTPNNPTATSSTNTTNNTIVSSTSNSANHYLCDIMTRGQEFIYQLLHQIESQPQRYSIPFPLLFTWLLEAMMDLGILCEKYLIHNYVASYQHLTNKIMMQQHLAATPAALPPPPKERTSGFTNVLASAFSAVIGPPSSPPPPTVAIEKPPSAPSTASTATLQQLTKSLKQSHEADLKTLQNLRGDLYGFLLEKLLHYGKMHPEYQLKGEIQDVLNYEQQQRFEGLTKTSVKNSDMLPTSPLRLTSSASTLMNPSATAATRIGIDDDVYLDMLAEYYPYEHHLNHTSNGENKSTNEDETDTTNSQLKQSPYALFQARHRRILECFETSVDSASTTPGPTRPSFSDLFLELCTCCLRMYWLSGRYHLCTRVAELKACIYYSTGDYAKSLDLFQTNCDRWRKDRWIQLYYPSLMMAIKAQQQLGRYEEVVRSCLIYLLTSYQHRAASRISPVSPSAAQQARLRPPSTTDESSTNGDGSEGPSVSWSRLGIMVAAAKRQTNAPIPANPVPIPSQTSDLAPLLTYQFPPLAPTAPITASITPLTPPTIQIVQLQGESASTNIGSLETSFIEFPLDSSPFLFHCCPHLPTTESTYQHGDISSIHIQQLLIHTLRVHLSTNEWSPDLFSALRLLAHRSKALTPLFPEPIAPSAKKSTKFIRTNNGILLTHAPIIVQTHQSTESNVSNQTGENDRLPPPFTKQESVTPPPLTIGSTLSGGGYVESSLHPFFLINRAELFVYRQTHPLHVVLEMEIESRFPDVIELDGIGLVILVERQSNQASHPQRKKPRKQMSVIVTRPQPPPTTQQPSLTFNPLPSPLPSQTISRSTSFEQLAGAFPVHDERTSIEPLSSDSISELPQPSASPEPLKGGDSAAAVSSDQLSMSGPEPSPPPKNPSINTNQLRKDQNQDEWICCFRNVTLQPGSNHIYLHIFHSAAEDDTPKSHNSNTTSTATAAGQQHHAITLYHSYAELEHLHATFEPSHAHINSTSTAPCGSTRRRSISYHSLPSTNLTHTYWTTKLTVNDLYFGLGRLQMWHVDLATFNSTLMTLVLTRAQRMEELISSDHKSTDKDALSDVDLDGTTIVDPHQQLSIRPPPPMYRPFSDPPDLSIDLLPIAPTDLLIGKVTPFHITIDIRVTSPPKSDSSDDAAAPSDMYDCVLHVASHPIMRLFGRQRNDILGQVSTDGLVATVHGLSIHQGKTEKKTYTVDMNTGDIALGHLSTGARLLLLLQLYAPPHLTHLLATKQVTLPSAASVGPTPHSSRPPSPTMTNRALTTGGANENPAGVTESVADLHSAQHPFTLDLTCSPVLSQPLPIGAPSLPSFLFSSHHSLTFMEPIQLRASIERLGHRWFLQLFLWNRCSFPLTIRSYEFDLPAGFSLKHDPNQEATNVILPPLQITGENESHAVDSLSPGSSAAQLAASTPVSYNSSNVYSLVFELSACDPVPAESSVDDVASSRTRSGRHDSLSAYDFADEAKLLSTYESDAVGRFVLQVDTMNATPASSSPPLLTLSWPIDVQIMSGPQDLHLMLSFPPVAAIGRLIPFTITIMYVKPTKRTKRNKSKRLNDNNATIGIDSEPAASGPLALMYELVAPSHLWLLAGVQTKRFTLLPGEQKSFQVQLLPIAAGSIPIPTIQLYQQTTSKDTAIEFTSTLTAVGPYEPIPPSRLLSHIGRTHLLQVYPAATESTPLQLMRVHTQTEPNQVTLRST